MSKLIRITLALLLVSSFSVLSSDAANCDAAQTKWKKTVWEPWVRSLLNDVTERWQHTPVCCGDETLNLVVYKNGAMKSRAIRFDQPPSGKRNRNPKAFEKGALQAVNAVAISDLLPLPEGADKVTVKVELTRRDWSVGSCSVAIPGTSFGLGSGWAACGTASAPPKSD